MTRGAAAGYGLYERGVREAWEDVLDSDRQDPEVGSAIRRFAADAQENIDQLLEELRGGRYEPKPLTEVEIADPDGQARVLHIPAVRDRIVERAVLHEITPFIDPWLGPMAYAYRPGLGVADAVQAVAALRDEGLSWLLHADVDNCFPSIPVGVATRMLAALAPADTLPLIDLLMGRPSYGRRGRVIQHGLAQGCALSPLLANLVLTDLDDALAAEGFPVVRYGDDFVVPTSSAAEAWEAARIASGALEGLGMKLGSDKTEVMSFEEGFCFLGEDFGPRYPPVLDLHRVISPAQRVVYVALQGCRVRTQAGRLLVESSEDVEVLDVPLGHVSRVVCFGSVGFSAGARAWALGAEVDVVFISRRGTYMGQLESAGSRRRVGRLRCQLAAADNAARCLAFGRAVVEAKIRKQIVLVQRLGRRDNADDIADALAQMRSMLLQLPECSGPAELMGVEGLAARGYFACLGALVPDDLVFTGRSRQPPLDIVNSALSYGYAILLSECVSALMSAGLDPAVGLLHVSADGRPSLALDLMEEFRPLIVDQVVIAAARRRELLPSHSWREDGKAGVFLTRAGKQVLLDGLERRMLQTTRGALPGFSGSLRRHIYRQAERIASFVVDPNASWTGLSWR